MKKVRFRSYGRRGWFVRAGDWSFGWDHDWREMAGWRPLSETYGSGRSWRWRGFELRRDGHINRRRCSVAEDRWYTHVPLGGLSLTDKGLRAVGVEPSVSVPLLDVPAYVDRELEAGAA